MGGKLDTGSSKVGDGVDALADRYEESSKAGREVISQRWRHLSEKARVLFISSGYYTERGARRRVEAGTGGELGGSIEDLEYNLGVLQRCAKVKLPSRSERNALISGEALSDEVIAICAELMHIPKWHEPPFLRLALEAIRKHQMASLRILLPAAPVPADKFLLVKVAGIALFALLVFVLTLAAPLFIGVALVSATKGELADTVLAIYAVGFVLWATKKYSGLGKEEPKKPEELAYEAWDRLGLPSSYWLATGAGAAFALNNMARMGAQVPPIAMDVCAVLNAKTVGCSLGFASTNCR